MKKYTTFIMIFAVFLLLVGCSNGKQTTSNTNKELLKIQSFEESTEYESNLSEPEVRQIDIDCGSIPEMESQKYDDDAQLRTFAEYIEKELGVKIDNNWTVLTHFYDSERTVGMIKFQYWIGNIGTDKCITFNLEQGKSDTVFYTLPNEGVDEDSLLERVQFFEERYEQEKLELKKGEQFLDETVSYAYYYRTGKLMYTYTVFFQYGEDGPINNEYGTECYIDENGYAVDINAI